MFETNRISNEMNWKSIEKGENDDLKVFTRTSTNITQRNRDDIIKTKNVYAVDVGTHEN